MGMRVVLRGYDGVELEIPSNPYPMYPFVERLNCISIDSASGRRFVFDGGPTRVNASILWKSVSYNVVKEYESFLLHQAWMGVRAFTITCPPYMDFGLEKGEDITGAYYAGSANLKDIIAPRGDAGLYYDIELPYMFVRHS